MKKIAGYKRFAWIFFTFAAIAVGIPGSAAAAQYDLLNYADRVVSYAKGTGGVTNDNPANALGQEDEVTVSLGSEGTLILEFTDNALKGDGTISSDISVLDHGVADGLNLYISEDGDNWLYVGYGYAYIHGSHAGTWNEFNIDSVSGYSANANYRYVKIVDDGGGTGGTAGFDVDAVATTQYSAVPLPSAFWLLGSGMIGLIGLYRRRTQASC